MTPQKKLNKIKRLNKKELLGKPDCDWLIARVEQLEKTLEFYCRTDIYVFRGIRVMS